MKTRALMIILLTAAGLLTARSQCMMGGGAAHKHDTAAHGTHDTTAQAGHEHGAQADKGYATITDDGGQVATVVIKDGYTPSVVVVKRGVPLTLNFDLQEKGCTQTVVMKDFDIRMKITPYEVGVVEFTPDSAGSFTFACPMQMIEGTLVVKD